MVRKSPIKRGRDANNTPQEWKIIRKDRDRN
jgi:hypothetical protein